MERGLDFIYQQWLPHTPSNLPFPSTTLAMGGHKRQTPDTSGHASTSTTQGGGAVVVELGGIADHIEKLKQVTTGTQKLVGLLGEQLQALSGTIPVLRALQIVRVCFHPIDLRRPESHRR